MSEKCVSLDLLILVWYIVFDVMLKEGMLFTNSGMQDACAMGCYKVYLV